MNVEYRGVWTLSEVRDGRIHPVSYELLAWGRDLADTLGVPLSAVLLGSGVTEQAPDLIVHGADQVYVVDDPSLGHFRADSFSSDLHLKRIIRRVLPLYFPRFI